MELDCLLPDPSTLGLRGIYRVGDTYHLNLEATAPVAACPGCGTCSARAHSRYTQHTYDLPVIGYRVRLEPRVRKFFKFFCDAPGCARSMLRERLPAVLVAYVHPAPNAGAHPPVNARQRKRRLAHTPVPPTATATAVGIDDLAFRPRRSCGTLAIDLDAHQPVDLLAGRSLELIRDYLHEHP